MARTSASASGTNVVCTPASRGAPFLTARRRHARPGCVEQPVLTIREEVPEDELAGFVAAALDEIHAFMHDRRIEPAGPPFSLTSPVPGTGVVGVEAGWPIGRQLAGSGRIHGGALPASLVVHSADAARASGGEPDPTEIY